VSRTGAIFFKDAARGRCCRSKVEQRPAWGRRVWDPASPRRAEAGSGWALNTGTSDAIDAFMVAIQAWGRPLSPRAKRRGTALPAGCDRASRRPRGPGRQGRGRCARRRSGRRQNKPSLPSTRGLSEPDPRARHPRSGPAQVGSGVLRGVGPRETRRLPRSAAAPAARTRCYAGSSSPPPRLPWLSSPRAGGEGCGSSRTAGRGSRSGAELRSNATVIVPRPRASVITATAARPGRLASERHA